MLLICFKEFAAELSL